MVSEIEKKILKTLLENDGFMHTTQVARISKISWNTAFAYLLLFKERNWIYHRTKGNRSFWKGVAECT